MDTTTLLHVAPELGALALLSIVSITWAYMTSRRVARSERRLNDLLGGVEEPNAAQMLAECLTTSRRTARSAELLRSEQQRVAEILPTTIRHVGLVRFSPFHDTGGDQSFALALLNGVGDGVVVTALHSRTDSRLYAKPIEHRHSSYTLTPEEREAIARAVGEPSEVATV